MLFGPGQKREENEDRPVSWEKGSGALFGKLSISRRCSCSRMNGFLSPSRSFWVLGGDERPALQFSVPYSAFVDKNRLPLAERYCPWTACCPSVRPHSQTLKTQRKFSSGGAYPVPKEASKITMKGVEGMIFFASSSDPSFSFFPLPLFVGRRTLSFPPLFPDFNRLFASLFFSSHAACSKNHPF